MKVTVLLSLFFVALVQYLRYIDKNEYLESWMNGVTNYLRLNSAKITLLCIKLRVK